MGACVTGSNCSIGNSIVSILFFLVRVGLFISSGFLLAGHIAAWLYFNVFPSSFCYIYHIERDLILSEVLVPQ